MSTHDERHEQALLEWLAQSPTPVPGDEWADHGERPHVDCGECRAFLEECAEQEALLEAAGAKLRRDLGAAEEIGRSGAEVPGEARVEDFLTQRLVPPASPLRPIGVLAAAAVLLVGFTVWMLGPGVDVERSTDTLADGNAGTDTDARSASPPGDSAPLPSDDFLGAPDGVALRPTFPVGAVPRYSDFAWEGTLPPDWTATVRVFRAADRGSERAASPAPLEESRPLRSSPWVPGASRSASWPDQIVWELELRDAAGRSRGVVSASASRSSH